MKEFLPAEEKELARLWGKRGRLSSGMRAAKVARLCIPIPSVMEFDRRCPPSLLLGCKALYASPSTVDESAGADSLNRLVKGDFMGDLCAVGPAVASAGASSAHRRLSDSSPAKHAAATTAGSAACATNLTLFLCGELGVAPENDDLSFLVSSSRSTDLSSGWSNDEESSSSMALRPPAEDSSSSDPDEPSPSRRSSESPSSSSTSGMVGGGIPDADARDFSSLPLGATNAGAPRRSPVCRPDFSARTPACNFVDLPTLRSLLTRTSALAFSASAAGVPSSISRSRGGESNGVDGVVGGGGGGSLLPTTFSVARESNDEANDDVDDPLFLVSPVGGGVGVINFRGENGGDGGGMAAMARVLSGIISSSSALIALLCPPNLVRTPPPRPQAPPIAASGRDPLIKRPPKRTITSDREITCVLERN